MNENRKPNSTNRVKFHRRNNKRDKFDPNRFYWCYGKGDIPVDMELVALSKERISHVATTIDQAKGRLRSDIREKGGNATMGLSIERGGNYHNGSYGYAPAEITASANVALVLPVKMPIAEKTQRKERLLALTKQPEKKEEKRQIIPANPFSVLIAIIVLLILYFIASPFNPTFWFCALGGIMVLIPILYKTYNGKRAENEQEWEKQQATSLESNSSPK